MNITDPIADMCTRIRNAVRAQQEEVVVPFSKLKAGIARILKQEGYILDYKTDTSGDFPLLRLRLKYVRRKPALVGIRRVSKPGRRVYTTAQKIPRVLGGMGISILTTSRGLMVGHQARKARLGGEILCQVW